MRRLSQAGLGVQVCGALGFRVQGLGGKLEEGVGSSLYVHIVIHTPKPFAPYMRFWGFEVMLSRKSLKKRPVFSRRVC